MNERAVAFDYYKKGCEYETTGDMAGALSYFQMAEKYYEEL